MRENKNHGVEIMAPAGSFESLSAALRAGADSIYFGVGKLNMRAHAAANFLPQDLRKVARLCHSCGARAYLTCNVVVYDEELEEMRQLLTAAKEAGVDAVIAADMAVVRYAREVGLEVHISVQANVSNMEAVRHYAQYADVIVPARELRLEQVRGIVDTVRKENICGPSGKQLRVELFAHGALCIAISGKCGMSLAAHNHSANRGDCYQPCRRRYRVADAETGFEFELDNEYVMSPRDLCTIRVLDRILDAGVGVLKLEGRGRSAAYVATVTSTYREAVRLYESGGWDAREADALEQNLRRIFNRDFWQGGYYLGEKCGEWAGAAGSHSTEKRDHLGRVRKYYLHPGVAEIKLEADGLKVGDTIEITGVTTGFLRYEVRAMRRDDEQGVTRDVHVAQKGDTVLLALPKKVRRGDRVAKVTERKNP